MATPLDHLEVFKSGHSDPVDVRGLEKELVRLWKSAAEAGESGLIQPVTRAAVVTLVAIVQGERAVADTTAIIARVTEHAPCRALVVNISGKELASPFSAWVSAHCHRVSGGRQVCCEQVTIAASPSGLPYLAGLIVPLLIPDLPVFIYWPALLADPEGPGFNLVDQLVENADYVVIDSAVAADPERAVEWMSSVTRQAGVHEEPRDLNWSRLLPWREAMADVFEPPEMGPWLREVISIETEAVGGPSFRDATTGSERLAVPCPLRPLLFVTWIANRLGWKRAGANRSDGTFDMAYSDGRSARVALISGDEGGGSIRKVILRCADNRSVEVARPSEHEFEATIFQGGGEPVRKTLPRHVQSEETLLCGELDRRGFDPVFRSALLGLEELFGMFESSPKGGPR